MNSLLMPFLKKLAIRYSNIASYGIDVPGWQQLDVSATPFSDDTSNFEWLDETIEEKILHDVHKTSTEGLQNLRRLLANRHNEDPLVNILNSAYSGGAELIHSTYYNYIEIRDLIVAHIKSHG